MWHPPQLSMAALSLFVLVGCEIAPGPSLSGTAESKLETITVDVIQVQPVTWPTVVRSQGSLFSDEQSQVGSKIAGRIAEVHVDFGDAVREGDPIVTLDQQELRLLIQQAEAQLEQVRFAVGLSNDAPIASLIPEDSPPVRQERALWEEAKSNLKRASNLQKENAISPSEFDQVEAAERVAEARYAASLNSVKEKIATIGVRTAELSLAQQQLEDAIIRSPLDGIVARREVAPGAYLSAGQTVATVVRTNPLRFRGMVPERYAQQLRVGQTLTLKIESIEEPRTTTITRISPMLDQQSRSLAFEADVENHGVENDREATLRTGLFAEAEIVLNPEALAIAIPQSALIEFAGAQKVWKVVDEMAIEHEVFCGSASGGFREVVVGLEPGDRILADASQGRIANVIAKVPSSLTASTDE